jgi:hypothetical protein
MGEAKRRGTREERIKEAEKGKRPATRGAKRTGKSAVIALMMTMLGLNVGGRK